MKKAKRLKKATLAEIAKLLINKEKTTGSTKWGVVKAVNTDAVTGKTTYNVQLDGASEQVQCAKLSGAKVGDVVAVNITATGSAVVAGTKNGDTDAADAQTAATNAYNKAAGIENHFWYDSSGAHVSTDTTIGANTLNTLINSGGMAIRKGTTELAKFTDNLVELGKADNNASISFANGKGTIKHILGNEESSLEMYSSDGAKETKSICLRPTPPDSGWDDSSRIIITSGNASSRYNNHGILILSHLDNLNGSEIALDEGHIIMTSHEGGVSSSLSLKDGKVTASGSVSASSLSATGNISASGKVTASGYLIGNGLEIPSHLLVSNMGSVGSGTQLRYSASGYIMKYSGSAKRFKKDIKPVEDDELNPRRLYDVDVVQFKYKDGHLSNDDPTNGKDLIGFIADQVEEVYPIAVSHDAEGKVQMWDDLIMIPAMLKLIQEQHEEIESLKQRVTELETK